MYTKGENPNEVACVKCGAYDFDQDESTTVCRSCGYVVSESNITSDIAFVDGNDGSTNVVGQFISDTGFGGGYRYSKVPCQRSREVTFFNGRRRITQVANALKLGGQHIDAAYRFFMLAIQHNFTQGRKTQNVIAACLYIACRRFKTAHMLIDFSDVLQTNVYNLGNTFLKLCQVLNINPPLVDPSLYIYRFAAQLELEEKEIDVANTALRLVQRMKRDWIQTGRRPAGVCGAALLISARIHGFKKSQKEIIQIVKICDLTLRRRLNEFDRTPSSSLTPAEFELIDPNRQYLSECDPPAFKKGLDNKTTQIQNRHSALPGPKYHSKVKASFPAPASETQTHPVAPLLKSGFSPHPLNAQALELLSINHELFENDLAQPEDDETIEKDMKEALIDGQKFQKMDSQTLNQPHLPPLNELETHSDSDRDVDPAPPLNSLDRGYDLPTAKPPQSASEDDAQKVNSNDIENVPFDDIKMYLLSPEEAKVKGIIWDELNRDYLLAMAEKEKLCKLKNNTKKRPPQKNSQIENPRKKERSSMINWAALTLQNLLHANSTHSLLAKDSILAPDIKSPTHTL